MAKGHLPEAICLWTRAAINAILAIRLIFAFSRTALAYAVRIGGETMRRLCLCGLALAVLLVSSCADIEEPNEYGSYDHVFSKNGLTFGPPFLRIQGSKEPSMRFEIWMNYMSNSARCLGSAVMDSKTTWSFYGGGSEGAQKPGTAKQMYEVPSGQGDYSIAIPLTLKDARECVWSLREVQMQILDPYIGERRDDLASFILRDEAVMVPIDTQYDIFCQKQKGRIPRFDCRHKVQNGKNVVVFSDSVTSGTKMVINVKASTDIRTITY